YYLITAHFVFIGRVAEFCIQYTRGIIFVLLLKSSTYYFLVFYFRLVNLFILSCVWSDIRLLFSHLVVLRYLFLINKLLTDPPSYSLQ
uniref:Uncharacterized protein n=1 Tax=Aegilops tauschii subsp. strangulata TaxID=200361 RepID=A0A453N1I4_AEGTS